MAVRGLWGAALAGGLIYDMEKGYLPRPTPGILPAIEGFLWGQDLTVEKELRNQAFVFIKPHANTEAVKALVRAKLQDAGVNVSSEGKITGEEINDNLYIDQHYYAIASKATILKPAELNVPKDKFKKQFGVEWDKALSAGTVYNAMDACKALGIDAGELDKRWAQAKNDKKLVKFGGGFYCGELAGPTGEPIYVFNGFFMSMRSKFTTPGTSIHYFTVDFSPKRTSWEAFRGSVLGPTDPADGPVGSLRREVFDNWENLGLTACPNVGDNAVHASASPFEGLAERMNWLKQPVAKDAYGAALLKNGVSKKTIREWSVDPQVKTGSGDEKKSLFDQLEDLDATPCLEKAVKLAAL